MSYGIWADNYIHTFFASYVSILKDGLAWSFASLRLPCSGSLSWFWEPQHSGTSEGE